MHKTSTKPIILIALVAFISIFTVILITANSARAAQAPINLGTSAPFAVLAGTPNITDSGNTSVIIGNVGLSPATGAGIGLTCLQVTGTIYAVDGAGPVCSTNNGPLMVTAKNDLTTAYNDAAARTPLTTVPTELGGTTLVSGVYDSSSTTFGISSGAGALVLDGQNDPSSVFIFQAPFSGTGLTVGSASTVSLVNGAQACNVFWRVDSASINSTATFVGTVLALNSISVANGATIEGRLLARNGNVTLINDTITVPTCAQSGDTDSSGEGDNVIIPGFPNTGESNNGLYFLAAATILLIVVTSMLLGYAVHRKHATKN